MWSWRRSSQFACAASLAAVALVACGKKAEAPKASAPALTVTATPVAMTRLNRAVDASGTVSAWEEVPVGAETGGLIAKAVNVDEGAYVRQGQVLVLLNDDLLQAELRQQDASLASAQARLAQQTASLNRSRELEAKGFLSQAALDTSLADHSAAVANVQSAQAARASAVERLKRATIVAPVSGVITSRSVVKGQIVSAGSELFRLVRDGQLEVDAQIPETELALVRPGMSAQVMAEEVGAVTGTVRIITPQVDAKTRLGLARVTLPAGSGFRPGMFARASIKVDAAPTPVVSQSSVVYRSGKAGVFIADAENRARFRPVQPGQRVGNQVAILSGLEANDRVIVKGAGFLNDGDRVTIAAETAQPAAAQPAAVKTPAAR